MDVFLRHNDAGMARNPLNAERIGVGLAQSRQERIKEWSTVRTRCGPRIVFHGLLLNRNFNVIRFGMFLWVERVRIEICFLSRLDCGYNAGHINLHSS
jgi:hypothetical protein